jgi:hypothetical protein
MLFQGQSKEHGRTYLRLLHSLNAQSNDSSQADGTTASGVESNVPSHAISAITLSHKCKKQTERGILHPKESDLALISSSQDSDLSDFDLVPIPSEDENFCCTPEDWLSNIILQWDLVVSNINKVSAVLKQLRGYNIDELDSLDEKNLAVDAKIGQAILRGTFEESVLVWDGLTLLHREMSQVVQLASQAEKTCKAINVTIDSKVISKMAAANA